MGRRIAVVSTCVALSACTNWMSDAPPVHPVPADDRTLTNGPNMLDKDLVPAPLLEKILTDAATRIGVPLAQLNIVSAEKITWDDGSLGCPQPDRMYTQALVPGYRIRVRSADQTLEYHAAEAGKFVLCSLPQVGIDDHGIG